MHRATQIHAIGVKLEYGPNQESNSTLITVDTIGEGNRALICSTDRQDCCLNESSIDSNWFLPNGSKIHLKNTLTSTSSYIVRGNQTVGLNRVENGTSLSELPMGIYHCEMMDKNNINHHLYVGIYPENEGTLHVQIAYPNLKACAIVWTSYCNSIIIMIIVGHITMVSIMYNKTIQTITCISIGGPATDVMWSKDNVNISVSPFGSIYEHSQIVLNTNSSTYENRLRIIDKSSKVDGTYTCEVSNLRGSVNESLYVQGNQFLMF